MAAGLCLEGISQNQYRSCCSDFMGKKQTCSSNVPIIIITGWLGIGTYKNIASEPLSVGWSVGLRVKGIKCEKCQNLFPTLNYCWVWDWEFVGRWQWQVPAVLVQKAQQSFNWNGYQCVTVVYRQLCVLVMTDMRKSYETVEGPQRNRKVHPHWRETPVRVLLTYCMVPFLMSKLNIVCISN